MASVRRTGRGPWLAMAFMVALAGCASNPGRTPLPAAPTGDRSQDFLAMGDRAAAAGELTTAAAFYQQAAGQMGDNVVALVRLGEVYLRDRRWPDAADVFARAVRLDGSQLAARRGYAHALIAMGQPASALAHLEEVLRATPDDLRALNLTGVAQDMVGQPDEAAATYRRALALAPGDPRLEGNLALSRALAGDYPTAIPMLERLAGRPDATPRTRQNLAVVYALAGDLAAARRTGLLDLDPASVERNIAFVVQLRDGERSAAARALLSANGAGQGTGDAGDARRARAKATATDAAPLPLVPEAGAADPAASAPRRAAASAARKVTAASQPPARVEPDVGDEAPVAPTVTRQLADAPAEAASVAEAPVELAATSTAAAAEAPVELAATSAAAVAGPPAVAMGAGAEQPDRAAGAADPARAIDNPAALPVAPVVLPIADAGSVDQLGTGAAPAADAPQRPTPLAAPSDPHAAVVSEAPVDLLGSTADPAPAAGDAGVATPLPVAPIVVQETAAMSTSAAADPLSTAGSSLAAADRPDQLPASVEVGGADPLAAAGATPASWLVRLGTFPDADAALAEWRSLKARHGDVLSGLTRLGQPANGAQALMAGPVRDEATAASLCRRLAARGVSCSTERI